MVAARTNGRVTAKLPEATAIGPNPTNGASRIIAASEPYTATVRLRGTADMLFHAWNCEQVAVKAASGKGSKASKTDDIESYVLRNADNKLCIPGAYLRGALINAAKSFKDPRSPRKSMADLFKAGVLIVTDLASLGIESWDYEHRCRMVIQRSAITRVRPAIKAGWEAEFEIQVLLPDYIDKELLRQTVEYAGKFVGIADSRPTYGRFAIVGMT